MLHGTFVFMKQALRQDTRFYSPSLMRLGILFITITSLTSSWSGSLSSSGVGLELIGILTFWNLFLIGLLSIPYFSSVITEEKEAQTIGLLRMTGIRPISILLGKSIPRQLNAILLLTIQFPFTLLAITLGGVLTHQVIAVYCSVLSFLFMIANICLFSSVFCNRSRSASWLSFGIIITVPIVATVLSAINGATSFMMYHDIAEYLLGIIPAYRIYEILSTGFSESVIGYQFYTNMGIGLFFFILSWMTFNLFVKSEFSGLAPVRGLKKKKSLVFEADGSVSNRKVSRVWDNAIRWKEFYFAAGGYKYYKWKFILYPAISVVFMVVFNFGGSANFNDLAVLFGGTLQVTMFIAILLEIAISVAKLFRDEINWKTYTDIYMLPFSIEEIAIKKMTGALLGLFPAVFYLILGMLINSMFNDDIVFLEILKALFGSIIPLMMISVYFVFLAIIFFLSLRIKRGAVPLAIAAMWVLYPFLFLFSSILFVGGGSENGMMFFVLLVNFGLITFLIILSRRRLVTLASDE